MQNCAKNVHFVPVKLTFFSEEEGDTPTHVIICCDGCFWKLNILNEDDDTIKSPDEIYNVS